MDVPSPSRRLFLGAAGLAAACPFAARAAQGPRVDNHAPAAVPADPFHGLHQSGIATPTQDHTCFAAFDVLDTKDSAYGGGYAHKADPANVTRADLAALMRRWSDGAARLVAGQSSTPPDRPAGDAGDVLGMPPERLTITFGFGPGLFVKDGKDRFGLAAHRPAALVDLPVFHGDQLIDQRSCGDISVQACADDPQVAFHAVRELSRLGAGLVTPRWMQTGFSAAFGSKQTPRNLMGFKDGTLNPRAPTTRNGIHPDDFDNVVWAGAEGPAWMDGGSYAVYRRIRIALEHWDRSEVDFQEQVVGRRKQSGAPLTGHTEFDAIDLKAADRDGNPVIPDNAHIRLASQDVARTQILRRGYSYNDGVSFTAERWPPWFQGMEWDAGLLFICYQKDPRTGFMPMYSGMAAIDAMNQFATHTASALFACPPGAQPGSYVGQALFET